MYGLKPEDITHLSHLQDAEIIQVCVGQADLQFHFTSNGNVSVQGRCELLDNADQVIDVWEPGTRSAMFLFLDLLGQSVTGVAIDSPKSFKFLFAKGHSLRVINVSEQYESFSVGNLYV